MSNNFNILDRPGSSLNALAVTGNTTITIPAGYRIVGIVVNNTTANAVTGGVRLGTTDGGVDVLLALAVGANALFAVPDATILLKVFSLTVDQVLYLQTVTLWNSASLNLYLQLQKITP